MSHPPTCWLCAGCGWVCAYHPERPFWSTRLVEGCPCDAEGAPCALVAHGAAWFAGVERLVARVRGQRLRVVA